MSTSPPPNTTNLTPQPGPAQQVQVPVAVNVEPAPRKFPAPCWTQEETLALINAYQDKWYSLRRRNLRTADWEAVADDVTRRCPPNQFPAKTSAQCRHKMEKLRKRYRTEKQRIISLPNHGNHNRFFGSSWVFFDLMDAMELGSGGSNPINLNHNNIINHNIVHNNNINNNVPVISNVGKADLEVKPFSINMNVNNNKNNMENEENNDNNSKKGDLGKYFDDILLSMVGRNEKGKTQNHDIKFKVKNSDERDYNHGYVDMSNDFDGGDEYGGVSGGRGSGFSSGFKRKSWSGFDKYDEMYSPKMVPLNGPSSKKESSSSGRDAVVGEMVASIKMLGEGLVKMEKMKMEMMREIEQMRMQMEIKRSEMILDSQHLIVNAFVQGFKKHKKVRVMEHEQ